MSELLPRYLPEAPDLNPIQPRCRVTSWLLLPLMLLPLTGCDGDQGSLARSPFAQKIAAERACITDALNEAILTERSDFETGAALDRQDIRNCPSDFADAFRKLRASVHDYLRKRHDVAARFVNIDEAGAAQDLNLPCSIASGKHCPSAMIAPSGGVNADAMIWNAEGRATYDDAVRELKAAVIRNNITIRETEPPPEIGAAPGALDHSMP